MEKENEQANRIIKIKILKLKIRAKLKRKEAKKLLCESSLMLAEASLLERGHENLSPEQIEIEARGKTPLRRIEIPIKEWMANPRQFD